MKIGVQIGSLLFLLKLLTLNAEIVEIVSHMYTEEILSAACFDKVKDAYELRIVDQKHKHPITTQHHVIKRFLIFNGHENLADLDHCPLEKKVLFMMEPQPTVASGRVKLSL